MNFRGHLTAGMISGAGMTAAAAVISYPPTTPDVLPVLGSVFGVTVFFALFPDLDISSIPQRWFFRGIFVLLLYLSFKESYELATLVALISITPLLDHHRGWTHHLLAPLLAPFVIAGIYEYLLYKDRLFYTISADHIWQHLMDYKWFMAACTIGWFTHLFVDTRFPFFRNH